VKKYLIIGGGLLVAWYVYKTYIQHNTAVGSFPTVGMGGQATAGTINPL
jgi:hypothetical protein